MLENVQIADTQHVVAIMIVLTVDTHRVLVITIAQIVGIHRALAIMTVQIADTQHVVVITTALTADIKLQVVVVMEMDVAIKHVAVNQLVQIVVDIVLLLVVLNIGAHTVFQKHIVAVMVIVHHMVLWAAVHVFLIMEEGIVLLLTAHVDLFVSVLEYAVIVVL